MGGNEDEIMVAGIRNKLPHYAEGPIVKGFGRGSTELGRHFLVNKSELKELLSNKIC